MCIYFATLHAYVNIYLKCFCEIFTKAIKIHGWNSGWQKGLRNLWFNTSFSFIFWFTHSNSDMQCAFDLVPIGIKSLLLSLMKSLSKWRTMIQQILMTTYTKECSY